MLLDVKQLNFIGMDSILYLPIRPQMNKQETHLKD